MPASPPPQSHGTAKQKNYTTCLSRKRQRKFSPTLSTSPCMQFDLNSPPIILHPKSPNFGLQYNTAPPNPLINPHLPYRININPIPFQALDSLADLSNQHPSPPPLLSNPNKPLSPIRNPTHSHSNGNTSGNQNSLSNHPPPPTTSPATNKPPSPQPPPKDIPEKIPDDVAKEVAATIAVGDCIGTDLSDFEDMIQAQIILERETPLPQ